MVQAGGLRLYGHSFMSVLSVNHLFAHQIFIGHLLWAKHILGFEERGEQDRGSVFKVLTYQWRDSDNK